MSASLQFINCIHVSKLDSKFFDVLRSASNFPSLTIDDILFGLTPNEPIHSHNDYPSCSKVFARSILSFLLDVLYSGIPLKRSSGAFPLPDFNKSEYSASGAVVNEFSHCTID